MNITVTPGLSDTTAENVVVFAFTDTVPDLSAVSDAAARAIAAGFVRRKANDVTPITDGDRRILIVGLGESKEFAPIKLRNAAGTAARYLRERGGSKVAMLATAAGNLSEAQGVGLLVTGAILGNYYAGLYKSGERTEGITDLTVLSSADGAQDAAERARTVAEAANFARDLVNTPANDLPPAELARRAADAAREAGLDVQVMGRKEIEDLKMAGILAVNSASAKDPSFTVIKHLPNEGQAPVVLVGKGITFDTGGISLKPGADMHHMKGDMGGAAAVVGTMLAVARLNLPVNVVGLVPSAENMPGGEAYRPSDVLTYANGKTVEIVNTDAEGRLILADGLIYGEREFQPRAMIDLATLTGACVIALGNDIAGIFTDDDDLAGRLEKASKTSTDPAWRMPLYHTYRSKFDSATADMENAGDRWGGAITAALFLAEFVEKTPWAHLDIAGPAFDDNERAYIARGGTGYGVSLLVDYLTGLD